MPATAIWVPVLILAFHETLIKRQSAFVRHHALQATIFQLAAGLITLMIAIPTCGIGAAIYPVFMVLGVVIGVAAYRGERKCYPLLEGLANK